MFILKCCVIFVIVEGGGHVGGTFCEPNILT